MMTFENQYWHCQNALAVMPVLSALFFLAIKDFEKHPINVLALHKLLYV